MRHTISLLVENKFGVLSRVAGLFSGRGYNIESISVGETIDRDISQMTIVTSGDETATTDALGAFTLTDVRTPASRVIVHFAKDGYFRAGIGEAPVKDGMTNVKVTMMVRQLEPTPQGLPLQIYTFW